MSEENNQTIGDIKTRLANLLINRVTLSETLNLLRDACVKRASDIIDNATEEELKGIEKDIEAFENPPKPENTGDQGDQGDQGDPEVTKVANVVDTNFSSGPIDPSGRSGGPSGPQGD
jgi:hypothetical protein